jgi:hypothetical protein
MRTAYDAKWITFNDHGQTYAVPMHAPRRIVALALVRHGDAKLADTRPAGSEIWHPSDHR